MIPEVKHAEGIQEHALCGLAFNAYESGDVEEPVLFAQKGENVTCEYCKNVLNYIKKEFNGFRKK